MKFFGLEITRERKSAQGLSLDALLARLDMLATTAANINVTPESALRSPTVQAVVNAITSKISTLPIQVFETKEEAGRTVKIRQRDHPVEQLLRRPNESQSSTDFIRDNVSRLLRYGNYYCFKAAGRTGPIRRLEMLHPSAVCLEQRDDLSVVYKVTLKNGGQREYSTREIHHARLTSSDGLTGDSPINLAREAIALEIAIESFASEFFGNGAQPGLIFRYAEGQPGFQTDEEKTNFLKSFNAAHGQRRRWRAMLLPKGIEAADPVMQDNEKLEFLDLRKFQRATIAAAFNCPVHLVGDLERATWSNIEAQQLDFVQNCILPILRSMEAAFERDLLTDEDRRNGIVVRFNVDAALRGSFLERQQGLKIQRELGIISPNEYREREGMNPRPDGDAYWEQGPSGQTSKPGNGGSDDGTQT